MVLTPYQSVISLPIRFRIMRHSHNIRGLTNKGTQHPRPVVICKCLFHRIRLSKNSSPNYSSSVMILCACQCLLFGHVTISPYRITAVFPRFCTVAIQNSQTIVIQYCAGKVEGAFRVVTILVGRCRIAKCRLIRSLSDTRRLNLCRVRKIQVIIHKRNSALDSFRQRLDISIHIRRNCGCIALFRLCFRLAGSDLRERSAHHIFQIANLNNCNLALWWLYRSDLKWYC